MVIGQVHESRIFLTLNKVKEFTIKHTHTHIMIENTAIKTSRHCRDRQINNYTYIGTPCMYVLSLVTYYIYIYPIHNKNDPG